jgi:hypothetical protein
MAEPIRWVELAVVSPGGCEVMDRQFSLASVNRKF